MTATGHDETTDEKSTETAAIQKSTPDDCRGRGAASSALDDDGIGCGLCGQPLDGMDDATDHLEDAHSVVTNAILSNTRGLGGGR